MYLDILHPSMQYILSESVMTDESKDLVNGGVLGAFTSKKDPNEFSLVFVLSFKDFDALFTGDIDPDISDVVAETLLAVDQKPLDYIKIPHHGSKNGLTKKLLDAVEPKVAVISSGKNNSYGHPHKEVLKILSEKDIKILRTDEMGDVVVESDGERVWVRK